jgi:hypothetical protein
MAASTRRMICVNRIILQSAWRLSGIEGQPPGILSAFLKISPTRTVAELSRSPAPIYRKDNQLVEFKKAFQLRTVAELSRSPASIYRKDNQLVEFQKAFQLHLVAELSRSPASIYRKDN